jgi:uncharacterized protein (TIGR03435 family)
MKLSTVGHIVVAGSLAAMLAVLAQGQSGKAKRPAFDVASVKPNTGGGGGFSMGTKNGRLTATNVPVRMLIVKGFHVKEFQLSGGPGWLDSERYDVVAKTSDTSISDDNLWLLLQPLLADRFKLRFHRETKQLPVYSLVVAKGGPKLRLHVPVEGQDETTVSGRMGSGKSSLDAKKVSAAKLADMLGDRMDRTVIDRSGLKGEYDFKLEWAQEHPGEPMGSSMLGGLQEQLGLSGASIFTALQDQLGLRLESAKGPVEIIVIDGVEKATLN